MTVQHSHHLHRHHPILVHAILDYLAGYPSDALPDPPRWVEVVEMFTTEHFPAKTVESALYDLQTFGAVYRRGHPAQRGRGGRGDTRALQLTYLGECYLDGTTPRPLRSPE